MFEGAEDVGGVTRGGDAEEEVAGLAEGFDLAGEDCVEASDGLAADWLPDSGCPEFCVELCAEFCAELRMEALSGGSNRLSGRFAAMAAPVVNAPCGDGLAGLASKVGSTKTKSFGLESFPCALTAAAFGLEDAPELMVAFTGTSFAVTGLADT